MPGLAQPRPPTRSCRPEQCRPTTPYLTWLIMRWVFKIPFCLRSILDIFAIFWAISFSKRKYRSNLKLLMNRFCSSYCWKSSNVKLSRKSFFPNLILFSPPTTSLDWVGSSREFPCQCLCLRSTPHDRPLLCRPPSTSALCPMLQPFRNTVPQSWPPPLMCLTGVSIFTMIVSRKNVSIRNLNLMKISLNNLMSDMDCS